MISIIISSYKESYYERVIQSIKNTIGVPYEIIKINNPGLYSITEAYNMGAAKALYQYLCFVHEDVNFVTQDWGVNLLNNFKNITNLGMLGVAGSKQKMLIPSGWPHYNDDFNKLNLIQHYKDKESEHLSTQNSENYDLVDVLDGVFLVTTKTVWEANRFDESVKGFHLYDLDFSLRVGKNHNLAVVYDVLLEHYSSGGYAADWIDSTIKYHKDKAHLFTPYNEDVILARKFSYSFLFDRDIAFKSRWLYIKSIGVDKKTFHLAFRLLFPRTGFFVHNVFSSIKRKINNNN
jgi:signal peptidase I